MDGNIPFTIVSGIALTVPPILEDKIIKLSCSLVNERLTEWNSLSANCVSSEVKLLHVCKTRTQAMMFIRGPRRKQMR